MSDKADITPDDKPADKFLGQSTTARKIQEDIQRALRGASELERMQQHLNKLTGWGALKEVQEQLDRLTGRGALQEIEDQLERLTGRSSYEKLLKNLDRLSPSKVDAELLQGVLGRWAVGATTGVTAELSASNRLSPFWPHLQNQYASKVGQTGSAWESMQGRRAWEPDIMFANTAKDWVFIELKSRSDIGSLEGQLRTYLDAIGRELGGTTVTLYDNLLQALHDPSPELKAKVWSKGEELAKEALIEGTPEGVLKRFVAAIRDLDPVTQLILTVFIGPIIVGLVFAVVNPVADYHVKKWLDDSPQGQVKKAAERVLGEAGGATVLASYRLTIGRPLVVRESPSALGTKMGTLEFGSAVRVLKNKGAFTFVEWRGEGETVMAGWVHTRYLKKFKRGVLKIPADHRQQRLEAAADRAIVTGTKWLTAQEIGELGNLGTGNSAAAVDRWKQDGKLFAVQRDGEYYFPEYALGPDFRPLPALATVIEVLGYSADRLAAWFESTSSFLGGKRPRELITSDPDRVIAAAKDAIESAEFLG